MPKLTIDNRKIEVPAGTKVIEAAGQLGIIIPRFCYHPALGSVGACRVCAAAFKEGPVKGIQMSCMINAQDEMVVSTTDPEAVDFRRHVIEWLMLNHPHDCPVCDEGGHCLLQDLTVAGGHGMRRYKGLKRTHQDQYLGPLIQHEMNRCIQCYRCARYYQEYAGAKDLGVMGIGTRVYFGRHKPGRLESPFAGNLIDICPTGVYTDKPSRFIGRRWDFQRADAVCLHCSMGCNLVVSARYRRVVRHEARPNPNVNGFFICDRGRYGYPYNNSPERPRQALAKGEPRALADAVIDARRYLADVVTEHGPQGVGVVGSVRSNLETIAMLDKICRHNQWGDPVFVHEERKAENLKTAITSFEEDLAVSQGAVSVAENVLIIGADPINETPMLSLSLGQAQRLGGHIVVIDPRAIELPLAYDHLPVPLLAMAGVLRHLIDAVGGAAEVLDPKIPVLGEALLDQRIQALTARLCECRRAVIICGTDITTAQEIRLAAELVRALRQAGTEAKLFFPLMGPNAFAAGRITRDLKGVEGVLERIESGQVKALVVVENDLWRNFPDQTRLSQALTQLDVFILMDYLASPLVVQADVFLPTQTLYETGGRWINHEARLQFSSPVLDGGIPIDILSQGDHPPRVFENTIPDGMPEAAWKLLLALTVGAGDWDVVRQQDLPSDTMDRIISLMGSLEDGKRVSLVKSGIAQAAARGAAASPEAKSTDAICLLLVDWTFGTDRLSESSTSLAEVRQQPTMLIHPKSATALGLVSDRKVSITVGQGEISLNWRADERMATNLIVVPRHHTLAWQVLGATRLVLESRQISAVPNG